MIANVALIVAAAVGWAVIGFLTAIAMRRRGHSLVGWAALGVVFGPFTIPLAIHNTRSRASRTWQRIGAGDRGSGPVDVLVGIDGSPSSEAALASVVEVLGPRLGRLTLATALDFETVDSQDPGCVEDREIALRRLERAASRAGVRPETVLTAGPPAEALVRCAEDEGYDLIAVGCRGRGGAKALLGSVASSLARGSPVPVMLTSCRESEASKAA